jgi:hypothetical protein
MVDAACPRLRKRPNPISPERVNRHFDAALGPFGAGGRPRRRRGELDIGCAEAARDLNGGSPGGSLDDRGADEEVVLLWVDLGPKMQTISEVNRSRKIARRPLRELISVGTSLPIPALRANPIKSKRFGSSS